MSAMLDRSSAPRAVIASVDEDSPAYLAGFEPGDAITAVDGAPLRDILDWKWMTSEDACVLSYIGVDGDAGDVELERDVGESWGIAFTDAIFNGVKVCKNDCTFCFMKQLPRDLRKTLYVRDDDVRLSFLQGNFVTLTNLDEADVARIVEQRISPLRVSLHASDPEVRRVMIGRNAQKGIDNLEALLAAGIEFDAQIVLVPGANDGDVLDETLRWAYERPNIKTVGIVPLGYTKHQSAFSKSFNEPEDALKVIQQIRPFQVRAEAERGHAWAYAADELYLNAYGDDVLDQLPGAGFYGDFSMFEDGIGIVRACVDDFLAAENEGCLGEAHDLLQAQGLHAVILAGMAMEPYFGRLIEGSSLAGAASALFVRNEFFGGNVNVTGLLSGEDMAAAIRSYEGTDGCIYLLPEVAFNSDGLTVDGMTADDIARVSGKEVLCAPSNPLDCILSLIRNLKDG
ncbi:MAG: DUF512 domain-containing protein [Eggerthellaceae bacterium]|nr:DUF512 domain-containing protein [Eggerthellaceae bacterium]